MCQTERTNELTYFPMSPLQTFSMLLSKRNNHIIKLEDELSKDLDSNKREFDRNILTLRVFQKTLFSLQGSNFSKLQTGICDL